MASTAKSTAPALPKGAAIPAPSTAAAQAGSAPKPATKKTLTSKKVTSPPKATAGKPETPSTAAKKARVLKSLSSTPAAKKPVGIAETKPLGKVAPTAKPVKAEKAEKARKPKLVRDSFTIPKVEYGVLDELKLRANKLAQPAKKSELLRAGIKALAAMSDATLVAALRQVPAIKTGRPAAAD